MSNQNKKMVWKMELGTLIVAAFTVVVMIIFGIIQYYTNKKANEALSIANQIQSKMLEYNLRLNEFDIKKGEILLLGLVGRYFIITANCWDLQENGPHKMLTDRKSIKKYISGLKNLDNDFNNLLNNTFYINLLEVYPEINLLQISLRATIIETEEESKFGINPITLDKFYNLYITLKNKIATTTTLNTEYYLKLDEVVHPLYNSLKELEQK